MNDSEPDVIPGPLPIDLRTLLEGEYFPAATAGCMAMRDYRARAAHHRDQANDATAEILEHARRAEFLDPPAGPDDDGWRWTP